MTSIATRSRTLLLAALALATAPLLTGCSSMPGTDAAEQKQDKVARAEYYETAAVTYYDGGRYELAALQFRRVIGEQPDNKKAKRGLAKSLYMDAAGNAGLSRKERAARLREAQTLLEEVVKLDWPNPDGRGSRRYEVQTDLALVYLELADLYDRDIRDLNYAMSRDPTAADRQYAGTVEIQISKRNELLNKAIPLFQEVMEASPENPYALASLSKAHLQLGNDELGIDYAQRYLNLSKRSQHQWRQQLDMYAEAVEGRVTSQQRKFYMGKIQGAREKEKKMHLMLGSVYMRRQEFGKAATSYSEVIEIDKAVPAAYLERAQSLAALRQYNQAVNDLEEYLKITDPALHRSQRMKAVELLDRYQGALARRGAAPVPNNAAGLGSRPGDAIGSPDGR